MSVALDSAIAWESSSSNGTVFNLYPFTVPENGFVNTQIFITAQGNNGGFATWNVGTTGVRGTGNASLANGGVLDIFTPQKNLVATLGGWNITFDIDGHDIYVKATPQSSVDIVWTLYGTALYRTP